MSSTKTVTAEDLLPFALDSAKTYQDALADHAENITQELKELDKLLGLVGHDDEDNDYVQLSVTLSDAKKLVGLLTPSELNHSDSPFAAEAARRKRYLHLTTPRPLKPKDLDLMDAAVKQQNERLRALQIRERLDWNIIAEKLSDAQAHKWTAEECRFKWMNDRHPRVNHKEWNNEEIDKLKRILAENKDGPRDWVEIAEELGTNRVPLDCMRKSLQIQGRPTFKFDQEAEDRLLKAIDAYGTGNWSLVARYVSEDVTSIQCETRYNRRVSGKIQKGMWSEEEDRRLDDAIAGWGHSWVDVAAAMYGRANDQCRDRYLERKKNSEPWSKEEDEALLNAFDKLGPKWATIANLIGNGRADNDCRFRLKRLKNLKVTPPQITQPLPEVDVADPTASVDDAGEDSAGDLQGAKAPRKGWHVYPTEPPAPYLPPIPYGHEGSPAPFAFTVPYPPGSAGPPASSPLPPPSSLRTEVPPVPFSFTAPYRSGPPISSPPLSSLAPPPPPSRTGGPTTPYPYGPPAFSTSYPYFTPRAEGPIGPYMFAAPYPSQGVAPFTLSASSLSAVPQAAGPFALSASSSAPQAQTQSNVATSSAPYPYPPRTEPLTPFTLTPSFTPEPPAYPQPTTSVFALNDAILDKPKATKKKRKEPPTPVESDSGTPAAALPRPKPRRTTKKQNHVEEQMTMDVDEPPPRPRPKPRRVTKTQSKMVETPSATPQVAEPTEAPAVAAETAQAEASSSTGTGTGKDTVSGSPTKAPRRKTTVSCAPRRTSSRAASKKAAAALAEIAEKDEAAMNETPAPPSPREKNNDHDMDIDK
ncbi:hypothetical protein BDZ89DRAFT_1058565 [Hymenopellis radicata]|nr:hypothetical protein BDZ89DRAFT_1058565 [Hymenopellis radicata]